MPPVPCFGHPDLCIRDAGSRRPGGGRCDGNFRPRRLVGWHTDGDITLPPPIGSFRSCAPTASATPSRVLAICIRISRCGGTQVLTTSWSTPPATSRWALQFDPSVEYRHRAWRDRCGRRVHLFQPADRTRVLCSDGLYLQLQQSHHRLSKRRRLASGLGASQFLSKQFSVGLVGYFYDQVSGDSGSGNRVGPSSRG